MARKNIQRNNNTTYIVNSRIDVNPFTVVFAGGGLTTNSFYIHKGAVLNMPFQEVTRPIVGTGVSDQNLFLSSQPSTLETELDDGHIYVETTFGSGYPALITNSEVKIESTLPVTSDTIVDLVYITPVASFSVDPLNPSICSINQKLKSDIYIWGGAEDGLACVYSCLEVRYQNTSAFYGHSAGDLMVTLYVASEDWLDGAGYPLDACVWVENEVDSGIIFLDGGGGFADPYIQDAGTFDEWTFVGVSEEAPLGDYISDIDSELDVTVTACP